MFVSRSFISNPKVIYNIASSVGYLCLNKKHGIHQYVSVVRIRYLSFYFLKLAWKCNKNRIKKIGMMDVFSDQNSFNGRYFHFYIVKLERRRATIVNRKYSAALTRFL